MSNITNNLPPRPQPPAMPEQQPLPSLEVPTASLPGHCNRWSAKTTWVNAAISGWGMGVLMTMAIFGKLDLLDSIGVVLSTIGLLLSFAVAWGHDEMQKQQKKEE